MKTEGRTNPGRIALLLGLLLITAFGLALIVTRLLTPLLLPEAPARLVTQHTSSPTPDQPDEPVPLEPLELDAGADTPPPADASLADAASGDPDESTPDASPLRPRHGAVSRINEHVLRLGPGRFRISREYITRAMGAEGVGTTRAVPVSEDGQLIGYRIFNVSPQLRQIGLRTNDIITHVNGMAITSPDRAIGAYGGLRNAERINLRLRRGGGRTALTYLIED